MSGGQIDSRFPMAASPISERNQSEIGIRGCHLFNCGSLAAEGEEHLESRRAAQVIELEAERVHPVYVSGLGRYFAKPEKPYLEPLGLRVMIAVGCGMGRE